MSLILSGSDGLSDIDGSAATPAIRGTDANTGIFFPAADTIAFSEGGVEAARFDSAGNLGLGTSTPTDRLDIRFATGTGNFKVGVNSSNNIKLYNTVGDLSLLTTDASSDVALDTQRNLLFRTAGSERARIDSSGNLLVGTTSGTQTLRVVGSKSGDYVGYFANSHGSPFGVDIVYTGASPNNTTNRFIDCEDTTTARFQVRSNGGIANYSANNANLSDRREKTNFAPAKSYLDVICAIPVQTFNYIDQNLEEDDGLTLGVVAQDVQAVAPEMVMESNWGTKEEPKMRLSIYQTDLQYALMKCIQEQQALITQLQADVAALKV